VNDWLTTFQAPHGEAPQECESQETDMKRLSFLFMALSLMVASALGQDVRYNYDKQADFSKFKTYKWVDIKGAQKPNDIVDKQIKASIDAELAKKGLSVVASDDADLFIGYQVGIQTEKEFTSFSSGMGPGWGYGAGWGGGWYGAGGMGTTTGSTSTIYIGQLAVDMYESSKKDLAWRGVASKTIDTKAKPDKQQKNLTKAVAKLFKNYPPPPGK
jgi:hypothetical protein